jgi:acetyl esterase/lipase
VASSSDPWLADRADPRRVFLADDSAGGNIAFHTAVRAGRDLEGTGGVDVEGLVLVHPYSWGPDRLPSELAAESFLTAEAADRHWALATGGREGNDDPWINPSDEDVAFESLTCRRALVAVAEKDLVRERVRAARGALPRVRWRRDGVTLVVSAGEDHGFHLSGPPRASSIELLDHIVKFINKEGSRGRGQSYRRRRQK